MSDEVKQETVSNPSTSPPPTTPKPSPANPLKRKEPPSDDAETKHKPGSTPGPSDNGDVHEEYNNGHIVCPKCRLNVSIHDESGGFTVKLWETHRAACCPPPSSSRERKTDAAATVVYTPENNADSLTHPPAKRRRAKRTEDERIDYLRADPYVAQFEPYRVLCASCDKWIRLRPNSTYCSIPWDAHRKSCLAKKINNKNAYALEERNNLFSQDPDIRKFDAERLLCGRCDQWLCVSADDHLLAVQKWLHHRASCTKNNPAGPSSRSMAKEIPRAPPPSGTQIAALNSGSGGSNLLQHRSAASAHASPKPISNGTTPAHTLQQQHQQRIQQHQQQQQQQQQLQQQQQQQQQRYAHSASGSPPFHDLNANSFAPIHESRRRNAEQRADALRKDHLIGEVEPNRVFCKLCQKWVQLRQDSSFCAYPWQQHRNKCVARHQRRAQKMDEIVRLKARRAQADPQTVPEDEDELLSDSSNSSDSEDDSASVQIIENPSNGVDSRRPAKRSLDPLSSHSGYSSGRVLTHHQRPSTSNGHMHSQGPAPSSSSAAYRDSYGRRPPPDQYYSKVRTLPRGYQTAESPHGLDPRHGGSRRSSEVLRSGREVHGGGSGGSSRPPTASSSASVANGGPLANGNGGYTQVMRRVRNWEEDVSGHGIDEDEDVDADADSVEAYGEEDVPVVYSSRIGYQAVAAGGRRALAPPAHISQSYSGSQVRRGMAELDSPAGRRQFVANSIEHLMHTTYESTDDMTISALLGYLNAAMPIDKHEDFDTAEVVKCVSWLKEKGQVVFQGDVIRLLDA
ncbi:hypothetical protein FA15DRAFT_69738 [Coprinopsis marcescibilis]|uniref:Uncharacterized protein n=1 Tax=Coprinopsis marcescibilis TaxID=230819 RepID=A0A5C3KNN8_COPMA|nr:hypothetical protein FA15DRAFT_69738 [Coprinopsis marcescibilis]